MVLIGDTAIAELLTPLDHTKVPPLQPEALKFTLAPAHTTSLSALIPGVWAAGETVMVIGAEVWLPQPLDEQVAL